MKKLLFLTAIASQVFLLGGCANVEPVNQSVQSKSSQASSAPFNATQPVASDYQVGEKWVWKFKGVTDKGVVRAEGLDARTVINDNGVLKISDGKREVLVSNLTEPSTSSTPKYQWPLSVGATWVFEEKWTSQDGTTGKTRQNAKVISYQQETVAAGTFMAYTIEYTGRITNSRGYNVQTDETIVYAPKVKNFIKLIQKQDDYHYVEELVEYVRPD